MTLSNFKGKKVLILGLGLNQGGVGAAKFFAQSNADVLVTDIKSRDQLKPSLNELKEFSNIKYVLGGHRFQDIDWADLVIRNPALKPDNPYRMYTKNIGKPVELDMGIFLQFVSKKQIIGVTGTKGKTTTATLIYQQLLASGKKVVLGGNLGKSVLDLLSQIDTETYVVLEVSSFQLEAFDQHKTSPHWAVITNIYQDHLNYYASMPDYINAKKIIAKYQLADDFLFLNSRDKILNNQEFLEGLKGQIKKFSVKDLPENFSPKLTGEHNRENFAASMTLSKLFNINQNLALQILQKFQGIKYRMELVKVVNGVKVYNDSASTNPDSTIQALKTFPGCILICGGVNKNLDYTKLAEVISRYTKAVYFLEGDATDQIRNKLKADNQNLTSRHGPFNDMTKLMLELAKQSRSGDIILFSPAAASFNLFQNEFDRGEKFNQAVEKIFYE